MLGDVMRGLSKNVFGGQSNGGKATEIGTKSPIELARFSKEDKLNQNPLKFSTMSYPKDIINDPMAGHYMLFYVNVPATTKFTHQSPGGGVVGNKILEPETVFEAGLPQDDAILRKASVRNVQTGAETVSDRDSKAKVFKAGYAERQALKQGKTIDSSDRVDLYQQKRAPMSGIRAEMAKAGAQAQTKRITDSVAIYLPPNVQENYNVNYNETETGLLGFLAASGGSAIEAIKSGDMEALAKVGLGSASGVLTETLKNLGLGIAETLTQSEGGYELLNQVFGRAANPYMEVLFSGVSLRNFTYNFTFMPRNEEEQQEVRNIIQLFRFHAAPELREGHSMFLTLPSEFDIHYMYQPASGEATENSFYNKIATCVLKGVNVDYTPGGVRSHGDGSPVKITMTLNFTETEMITKDHINAGY